MLNKRWQDVVTLVAGVWFAIMPWVLGEGTASTAVIYNALGVGAALVLFSAGALVRPKTWEEVVDFLVGIWAVISPWVLGFTDLRRLTANVVAVGVVVAVLAGWNAMERGHLIERWHKRRSI